MRQRMGQTLRSRIVITIVLVVLLLTLGGAAWSFKKNYVPGPVSAMQLYGEPLNGYSSHAEFERECLHCHAPVRCLSANLCQDCHREIAQERAESEGLHALLPGTDKCQTCHPEHQGRDVALAEVPFGSINHERLGGFYLDLHTTGYDGTPLTCESCHPGGNQDATSAGCADCHSAEAPEATGAHTLEYGENCAGCHDGKDRMIGFEHGAVYALEGGHGEVDCSDCHPALAFGDEERACVDCHEDPEVHEGQFGLDCGRCHTAEAWLPAQLREHLFRLDHGGEGGVACETCHVGSYVTYGCYGCHDHVQADTEEFHTGEGIEELEPCGDCHPTGREGEAREAGYGS